MAPVLLCHRFVRQQEQTAVAEATAEPQPIRPKPPRDVAELSLPGSLLFDLLLRFLREHGSASLMSLRRGLKLSYPVVNGLFEQLRQQQLVEIRATIGSDFQFSLTGIGRQMAAERSTTCRYTGPVPVPLDEYAAVVRSQRCGFVPTPADLEEVFSDLVLEPGLLNSLGPALVSGRPLLLYGPSGNGKSSIIERLPKLLKDTIAVPYAVEVDGQIVSVYDPLVHGPAEDPESGIDPRWVLCRRPTAITGGELVPSMLGLHLDELSGVYGAPLQMKANNGIFLIDDFGRQAMSPRELLNRWILPLDRRVDYLSLPYGFTFQIPFEVQLAFATNLEPSELADRAFLRRVPNKIFISSVEPAAFDEIWRRTLDAHGSLGGQNLAAYARELCLRHGSHDLSACYPRDLAEIIVSRARYLRQPVEFNRETIEAAVDLYFADRANR